MSKSERNKISIADLYPELSIEQQKEAEENLRQYIAVCRRIFLRIQTHHPKVLTELRRRAKVRKEKAHKHAPFRPPHH